MNYCTWGHHSYRSSLCLQFTAMEIGMSLLFLATLQVGIKPTAPSSSARMAGEVTWSQLLSKEVEEDIIRSEYFHTPCILCMLMYCALLTWLRVYGIIAFI